MNKVPVEERETRQGNKHLQTILIIYTVTFEAKQTEYLTNDQKAKSYLMQTCSPLLPLFGVRCTKFIGLGERLQTEHAPLPISVRKNLKNTAEKHYTHGCDHHRRKRTL